MRGPWARIEGQWLLNFVSTNYLGLANDPRLALAACSAMRRYGVSLGTPTRLAASGYSERIEHAVAQRVGQPDALLFPSTSHAARDALHGLCGTRGTIAVDARAYPISLDAARLAALKHHGMVRRFPHQGPECLLDGPRGVAPRTIVCDGVYPATGDAAVLSVLIDVAEQLDAVVYVDDAHGFGVLGRDPESTCPYGRGGGGAAAYCGVPPDRLVQVSSLSKAFGAPLAVVAGPRSFIQHLRATAGALIHSSPPAIPTLAAAAAALAVDAQEGAQRRQHLARMVARFRAGLARLGAPSATAGMFPIQSLHFDSPTATFEAATRLRRNGIWCAADVAARDSPGGGALRFVLSAAHCHATIDAALERIEAARRHCAFESHCGFDRHKDGYRARR